MISQVTRVLAVVLAIGPTFGCSRDGDTSAWISEQSAVVRCASPGKRPPPPVMDGVPAPLVPTGLFARQLDPVALDALGYLRDSTVCATLEAPVGGGDEAAAAIAAIVALHESTSREALRAGGRCTCEIARAQGLRELIAACVKTPSIGGCDPAVKADAVAAAVAPLAEALDDVPLPWMHWRLVGPTDRPGWFVEHLDDAIANHDGGSLVYEPGDGNAPRADEVVRAMLGVQGVVAVVRQDAGRAVVVARELDGMLVLDHFRQPLASAERAPLVARLEAAQVTAMASALSPSPRRALLVAPNDGTLIEIDRALLEEIDRAALATRSLLDLDDEEPTPAAPPALFDRIAWISPFGESGTVLRIEHQLSADGLAWAQTLGDLPLIGNLGALGVAPDTPIPPEPPRPIRAEPQRFVLRDTPVSTWGVHGVHRFPAVANLLEIASPGSLGGDQSAWRIDWPAAALPSELTTASAPYAGVRALATSRAYRLESKFDAGRTRFVVEIRPK
jgi:hypothetical protein